MEKAQETIKQLPHAPGVYIYRDNKHAVIYIGKAKDLKKRVGQYWERDAVGPKTRLLVSQIRSIETIQTASELDALLLEARLIHTYQPKYNVVLKDDKSPLYILLTLSETLPHVFLLRKSDLPKKMKKKDAVFGPFQSAGVVRSLMRQLRHIVPYCTQKRRTGKPCFYAHIGLCNPCPSDKNTKPRNYRKNIIRLKNILLGKEERVRLELEKEMRELAKEERYEEAAIIRGHLSNLYGLLQKQYDPMLYLQSDAAVEDIYKKELDALSQILSLPNLHRIECIDISNTQGSYATGSLVVLTEGHIDTQAYRRFRIRRKQAPNDFAMMKEVVKRRFSHPEWPNPDLLVIDGGKGQVRAAHEAPVPIIGLAKRFEEIIVPQGSSFKVIRLDLTSPALNVLRRIRDEAHRFAIRYHRLLRSRGFGTIEAT